MYDLTWKEKVDRLPVLVSGKGGSLLMTVVKTLSAIEEARALAAFEINQYCGITDTILAIYFDTTLPNTDYNSGACFLRDPKFKKIAFIIFFQASYYETDS